MLNVFHLLYDADVLWPLAENLIIGLRSLGIQQVVGYLCGDEQRQSSLIQAGITVVGFHYRRRDLEGFRPRLALGIRDVLDAQCIDLVHAQRHKPTVYGSLAARLSSSNIAVVTTVHGRKRTRSLARRLTNRFVFANAARILAVSEAVRNDVLATNHSADPAKVITVYNGIDARKFNPAYDPMTARAKLGVPRENRIFIGMVGRLKPVKAHDLLLQAFDRIADSFKNVDILLAGEGPLENSLRQMAMSMKRMDRIHFLGFQKDVPRVLRAMDIFVLPSRSEGHPLALLEAMAAGLPVIASDVGGIPETLSGMPVDCLFPPGNIEELARKLTALLSLTAAERSAIGRQMQARVEEKFTVEKMVAAVAYEYASAVPQKQSIHYR